MPSPIARRPPLVLLAVLLIWLSAALPVFAHAVPVQTTPRANASLDAPPPEVSITFSEPVEADLSRITILTQAGEEVPLGPLESSDEGRTLAVPVDGLETGAYLVSWQALSSVDGHTTNGTFSFGVGASALATGSTAVSARFSALSAAARWQTLTGIVLLIGLFAFRLFVWRPILRGEELSDEEAALDARLWRRALAVGLVGAALLGLGLLLVLADRMVAGDGATGLGAWLGTSFGRMWLIRLGLTLVTAGYLFWLRRREETWPLLLAGLALSLVIAATVSLSSHSAALLEARTLATLVDFAHIAAAGVWVGGLVYLLLALNGSRVLPAESRTWLNLNLILNFSALAAAAVGLLLVSGGYLAWQHLGSWSALVGTAYGRILLLKLALAMVAFALAGVNLVVIKPHLAAAYDEPEAPESAAAIRRFRGVVYLEAIVALCIIAAAGLLSDMQRGKEAPYVADTAGRMETTQTVEGLDVTLALEPALLGNNTFIVSAKDDSGQPVQADEVKLRFTFLTQSLGSDEAAAEPAGDGSYRLEGSYISVAGPWQVEVAIRRPGSYDVFAPFRLDAALGGRIQAANEVASFGDRFVRLMNLGGGLATGVLLILLAIGWGTVAARAANRPWQLVPLLGISILLLWFGASQIVTFFERDYTPSRFLRNTVEPDAESIAIGRQLYDQRCATCHGPEGRGDGPGGVGLAVPPIDFTAGHTATHLDGDLYFWIQNGIEGSPMPAFKSELSREETWHLVNYIRRLIAEGGLAAVP